MKGVDLFIQRLQNRGVTATPAMIAAVERNGGNFTLEKYRVVCGGWSKKYIERYPVDHWTELSDTEHITPAGWRYLGEDDKKNGLEAMSDNPQYLIGYGEINKQQAA
jgi:hypothetical protein